MHPNPKQIWRKLSNGQGRVLFYMGLIFFFFLPLISLSWFKAGPVIGGRYCKGRELNVIPSLAENNYFMQFFFFLLYLGVIRFKRKTKTNQQRNTSRTITKRKIKATITVLWIYQTHFSSSVASSVLYGFLCKYVNLSNMSLIMQRILVLITWKLV